MANNSATTKVCYVTTEVFYVTTKVCYVTTEVCYNLLFVHIKKYTFIHL